MTNLWPDSPRGQITQINKIRNENGEISTDTAEIQKKKKREYYEQVYAKKFDNLEEMDNFLEINSPPKLNQERDHLNRLITRNEIEYVIIIIIIKLITNKILDQMASQSNSTKHTKNL